MTREEFDKFLEERPLLTLAGLSRQAGKTHGALRLSLPKTGEISPKILQWLMPLLHLYGYQK